MQSEGTIRGIHGEPLANYIRVCGYICGHCQKRLDETASFIALGAPYSCGLHPHCAPHFRYAGVWPHAHPAIAYDGHAGK